MKIHQISLFLENKPGQLVEPCRLLASAGVDIRTMTLADTERFGILRMIVSDWQKAAATLKDAGFVVNLTEVLAVEAPDRPGGLAHLVEILDRSPVNIEYMYAFSFDRDGKAVLIFRFDDADRAIQVLMEAGINVLDSVEIYRRIEQ
jgi:hypothetical protein